MPWPVHPNGLLGASGDNDSYRIERSLRFNEADFTYLSRTMGTPTSQTTATLSLWVKRNNISKTNFGDAFWDAEASNYNVFAFSGSGAGNTDTLQFSFRNGGTYYSNAVYRDPSAWYHILAVYDSTNATQADRFRFFVNGVRGTFISAPAFALNYTFEGAIGAGSYRIGDFSFNSSWRPNFYLAEYYWIDGQALTPSSFGETDAITGRWKAKAYSGTYGTNGFYLKFADNSGTTATTLGKDSSPNGNNWTPNNFSVTAGTGNDSLVDSPTNYGSDAGVGGEVRGNYCTLNPLKNYAISLTNGNLDGASNTSTRASIYGTVGVSSGKWYWEVTQNSVTGVNALAIGIANGNGTITDGAGATSNEWVYYGQSGQKVTNNILTAYGASFTTGDTIGVAFDADSGTLVFYKNNASQGTAFTSLTSGPYFPAIGDGGNSNAQSWSANFGQRPFAYTAPTGFKALCTTNLPTPTIKKPSSYFDAIAYTGTGASNSISSLGFSPDLVWIKNRGAATSHAIYDTTRGTQAQLSSDLTSSEVTSSTGLTAFGSNGFTIGTSTLVNTTGTQYVAWAWDEAPIAGMDIVSYTGTGAIRTVAHNLGVAPKMIIAKLTNSAGFQWPVYHSSLTSASSYIWLNSTNAQATDAAYWGTAPTSSVFSVGTNANVNNNTSPYIAYCFAEVEGFSKIGSYIGNGSADGPFVYCGFRPRWMMVKNSGSAYSWIIYDTARNTENLVTLKLAPNNSQEENGSSIGGTTFNTIDILSNGFKLRSTNVDSNQSSVLHIFAAFAESPFKYARAR